MTSPVTLGFPDWARPRPFSDQVLANGTIVASGIQVVYGPWDVSSVPALFLRASSITHDQTWQIVWNNVNSAFGGIDTETFNTGQDKSLSTVVRPRAPFMAVVANALSVAGSSHSLFVSTQYDPAYKFNDQASIALINVAAGGVGATSIVTDVAGQSVMGEVFYNAFCTAAVWTSDLQYVDAAGAAHTIARTGSGYQNNAMRCFAPGGKLQIVTHNFDGVAKNYDAILMRNPRIDF